MIGISQSAEIERFNTETVTDPKRERVIDFVSLGQRFITRLEVPIYIDDKLLSEDWAFVEELVKKQADHLRRQAALDGTVFVQATRQRLARQVNAFARMAVYNQFMKYQVKSGNHEGHEVPHGW